MNADVGASGKEMPVEFGTWLTLTGCKCCPTAHRTCGRYRP